MRIFQVSLIGQDNKVLLEGSYKCLNKIQTLALFNAMIKDKDPFQRAPGYCLDRVLARIQSLVD